ncbi:DnaD domain-containing protein [Bacillus tianshenii]|uniref:DnaD domain-containing protein n=1 Tax=Sutcliffiella tianshenii TaxID=1463404 RepID=UPI001CD22CBF|nr:DnaD domain-containing protein [Bacillus tianshenii]MCA1320706.1 DnaD domain-containing protein [Bacillus tianshenii]
MKKEQFIEFLEEGNLSIPNYLLNNYVKLGLNEKEFLLILHVHSFVESGKIFPTPMEIADKMTIDPTECMEILRHLLQKGYLAISDEMDEYSIKYERYSLQPLWEKMIQYMLDKSKQATIQSNKDDEASLYTIFEQEFGRPLSPFECETLGMWMDQDHHDPTIIKAALREAVISGKLNFRYIDRILFEWKKNGIKTLNQANEYGKKFRKSNIPPKQQNQMPVNKTNKNTVPFYNWLD